MLDWIASIFLGACACAPATQSALVDARDPDTLQVLMQDSGYAVTQSVDKYGDPQLEGRISKTQYRVLFYGCTEGKDCTLIQFSAGYNMDNGMSLETANEWNRDRLLGKVFLDNEDDPFLQMPVNMHQGITSESFLDTVDWWRITVEEFEEYIDW